MPNGAKVDENVGKVYAKCRKIDAKCNKSLCKM